MIANFLNLPARIASKTVTSSFGIFVQHSNLDLITELKSRLSSKSQKGQRWCHWSTEIRTLFGSSEKCTLDINNFLAIQGFEGFMQNLKGILLKAVLVVGRFKTNLSIKIMNGTMLIVITLIVL